MLFTFFFLSSLPVLRFFFIWCYQLTTNDNCTFKMDLVMFRVHHRAMVFLSFFFFLFLCCIFHIIFHRVCGWGAIHDCSRSIAKLLSAPPLSHPPLPNPHLAKQTTGERATFANKFSSLFFFIFLCVAFCFSYLSNSCIILLLHKKTYFHEQFRTMSECR